MARGWVCVLLLFSGVAEARICQRISRTAVNNFLLFSVHNVDNDTQTIAHISVSDPHHQTSSFQPFRRALSDPQVNDRIRLLHASLEARGERLKVRVDRWNIWVEEASKKPSAFTPEELAGPARLFVELAAPLDESPDLSFHGIVSRLFFDELEFMNPNYLRAMNSGLTTTMAELREKSKTDPALAKTLAETSEGDVRQQIHDVFKLRATWILKAGFYYRHVLESGERPMVPPSKDSHSDIIERVAQLYGHADNAFDQKIKSEFVKFYSTNVSQRLDANIILGVWDMPLPGMWESSLTSPSFVNATFNKR